MAEVEWRATSSFETDTRRIRPDFVLADVDGSVVTDPGGDTVGGLVRVVLEREEVTGPKPFDTLVLRELIDVNYYDLTTTIALGGSLSAAVTLQRRPILAIIVPAGWDDADLTFQVSQDGITYYELVTEAGAAVQLDVVAGKMHRTTNLDQWAGYQYMKVRSGTFGTPVTQSAARTITLTVRDA